MLLSASTLGCGSADARSAPSGEINVFAAASLGSAFAELAAAFESEHADTAVVLNVAASSELVAQIAEGAPADVFASADEVTMERLVDGIGTVGRPEVFATNVLQIVVEAGNPLGISDLTDLADPAVLVVAAAPEVPIGRYTQQVLDAAGVDVVPRSFERNVSGVVGKVLLGEADAGIVYATDVIAAGDRAEGVEIPADQNVVARYPIAVPSAASDVVTARWFVEFVGSDAGRTILASYGFTDP
ncbi:molybdate ABC transporter substrate-binding protein [soil metagenome]